MRLQFATRSAAQAFADKVHAQMIATNRDYEVSALLGQTTAWAKPYQDEGDLVNWYVNLKDRAEKTLTTVERAALKPFLGGDKVGVTGGR